MAKGRLVTRKIATDKKVSRLSIEAAFFYMSAIPWLDRDGIIEGDPWILIGKIAPTRISELGGKVRLLIQEWIEQGLVTQYEGPDGPLLFFPGFRKHNSTMEYAKEEASTFPPPPGWFRSPEGLIPNDSELAARLAENFYATSAYGQALRHYADHGKIPAPKPAKAKKAAKTGETGEIESKSRETLREDQSEDQEEHAATGDQTDRHASSPGYGNRGDARGGNVPPAGPSAERHLIASPAYESDLAEAYMQPPQLYIDAITQAGEIHNIWSEWRGNWQAWLEEMDTDDLLLTLSWLWKWWKETDPDQMDRITNMPGLLKKLVKEHSSPRLRPAEFRAMLQFAGAIPETVEVDL